MSGSETQRIKLTAELQLARRGPLLYVLDKPNTGLHPFDVDKLMAQLHVLVNAGNNVIVVEHKMRVVAACAWVVNMGPGPGELGGRWLQAGRRRW